MIGKPSPRGKKIDKQGGTGPRFGSPLAYVLLVLVAFLLLRTLFQDAGFQRVPYSRLMDRIQSDGCQKVVLSQDWVKCYPKGAEGSGSRSELPWFAVRVQGDTTLIPLLESKHIEYEAVAESSTTDMIWMLAVPIGLGLLFVSWLTRRMSGGDARRSAGRDELRQDEGAHLHGGDHRRHLQGRGRHRRGGRRAEGDRRVPQDAREVPAPGRTHPEGRAAGRSSGNGQDAPRARRRGRGGRALLLPVRLGVRRDVRRRRRRARARPLPAGCRQGARDH